MSLRILLYLSLCCLAWSGAVNLQVRFGLIEAAHAVNLHIGTGRVLLGKGNGGSGPTPPPVGCAGTGFDFTKSCNSQYLAVF